MIARITIVAVTVTTWGLLAGASQAQTGPQRPVIQTGRTNCDTQCADAAATCSDPGGIGASCDGGCDSCGDSGDSWRQWISVKHLGLKHHPRCSCLYCKPRHTWASFDALMWWGKGRAVPALATGGPDGVLPGAGTLFGDGNVGTHMAAGARTDFGLWLDQYETIGVGAKFWGLHGDRTSFSADTSTVGVIGRPFNNVLLPGEDAVLVSSPGLLSGSLNIATSSSIMGAEAYLRSSLMAGHGYNIDLLGGYQFLRLDDDIAIRSTSVVENISVGAPVGTVINVLDSFDAKNEFHGGEFGVVGEFRHGRMTVTALGKTAVGNMRQSVRIDGRQTNTTPSGTPSTTPGGLLALPTNMGAYSRNETVWIPEIGLNASYEVRSWLRLSIGYSAIWISDVAFSGDQIDTNVNPSQLSGGLLIGPPQPAFSFQSTDYWLHGMNLGATITF